MNQHLLKAALVASVAGILAAGCYVYTAPPPPPPPRVVVVAAPEEIEVTQAPPPAVYEVMTPAPGPGMMWLRGSYVWEGGWIWRPGHWDVPPRPGAIWLAPHYEFRSGRHIFVRGGWR